MNPHLCVRRTMQMSFVALVTILQAAAFGQVEVVAGPQSHQLAGLDYSSDGSRLIIGGTSIRVYDANTGELLRRSDSKVMTVEVKFAATNRDLFASRDLDGTIHVWRTDQVEPITLFKKILDQSAGFVFPGEGNAIYIVGSHPDDDQGAVAQIEVLDIETQKLIRRLSLGNGVAYAPTISSDGKLLAVARLSPAKGPLSNIDIVDLDKWTVIRSIPFGPGGAESVSFAPDNQCVVISGAEHVQIGAGATKEIGKVWLGPLKEGEPSRLITTGLGGFQSASQMPDNEHFFSATETIRSSANGLKSWLVPEVQLRRKSDGEPLWTFEGTPYSSYGVQYCPEKKLVACCLESSIVLLDSKTGKLMRTIYVNE